MPDRLSRYSIIFAVISFVLLTLAQTGTARATDAPVRLSISVQLPATSSLARNIAAFKQGIEKRLGTSVEIEILDGPRAINDLTVAAEVGKGTVDMALINLGTLPSDMAAVEFINYPFLLNTEPLQRAVTDPSRPIRPVLDKNILDATGIRVLWWQPYGSNVLFSKGKDAGSPFSIQGRKVRVHSESGGQFVRECGGNPVVISAAKQKDALGSGEVEFVMTGAAGVENRHLWQVADTITRIESAPIEFLVGINEQAWQKLGPSRQAIFRDVAGDVEQLLRDENSALEAAYYEFARQKGMKIVELRPDQLTDWRACSSPAADRFMDRHGEKGFYLMAAYGRLRTDPCCGGQQSATPQSSAIRPANARP